MRTLVATALRLRWVVVALSILLLLVGWQVIQKAPLDVFPEFSPILVEVQTEAPGLSTTEVESLITTPIENALNGVKGMKTMRSKSVLGLSSVVLIFGPDTELMADRQLVQERLLTLSGQLPILAKTPVILSPLSSTSRVMKIGVWSGKLSQTEMTTLIRWTVRPRLMSVPGVANVAIWGQRDRQVQVLVDPDRLRDYKLSLAEIIRVTQDATMPAAGGFVETANQRLSVTHMPAVHSAEDLKEVPVAFRNGAPLLLGRVANVTEGHQAPIGDAVINDQPGLLLIVEKQLGANTLEVTRNVEKAVAQLGPGLQGVQLDTSIFRPATFIEMSLENLKQALIWGCILVAAILILFLFEWRTAAISLTAIPLSLITAALVLHWRGATLNTMVIAGLAIALGEVVDDAIIDVENVLRRLRMNHDSGNPQPAWKVVLEASLEVRSAVVYATIIVVLVFLPVFFLDGLAGTFFRPLALSYILAVLASLAIALTVTPALCLLLLPKFGQTTGGHKETALVRGIKSVYRRLLPPLLARPKTIIVSLVCIFLTTGFAVTRLGEEFLPHFQEYDFLMHWVEKPGTSLSAMQRITARVSRELRAIPGVRNFGSHIGRAEVADEVVGPNFTELWISLDPKVPYAPTVAKIQEVVDGYPGLYRDLLTYLKERIKEVLSGGSGAIVVRLYGPNLEVLRQKAAEVSGTIAKIDGIANLIVEPQVDVPQIEIRVRPEAAQRFGLTAGDVRRAAMTLIRGTKVGEIYEDQRIFDVSVWTEEATRNDIASLGKLWIDAPLGAKIPLEDVAELRIAPTPNLIQHENASRKIDVSCNVKGRDLGSVAREIEQRVHALPFEPGYHPELLGEYAARQAGQQRLFALSGLSLLGILIVLYTDFRSPRLAGLVFVSLPFALVGGVACVLATGGVLSLGSLVGFVTVLGIAARNGVMMVSHYRHLQEQEGESFGPHMILRGAEERLVPILMTAAATALALLPIVLGGNKPGHEIEHPMAVVILGGLATSTLLNLFVLPVLSLRFGHFQQEPNA
ncbi:efflux RND transporter permease subunit [Bryobacter aggregatus]|uniref:efflux RND transporter permease subunit n=1 Tax=Bryobacter aggregatus TaxID=360054 RepID=UPI0004E0DE04|nr:efflux RND transporter permease subunit [Bryobacter aggregatus]